ncbi:MAG: SMI1/KNR4 family protein [Clostridia bacterium]|nr:SMI1/KNR4 family protein [Clostridia bacterium]
MNKIVNEFFENEKLEDVLLEVLPNGVKYIVNTDKDMKPKAKILHTKYKGLTDKQIDFLQKDVNDGLKSNYVFPEWYRDFLKTSNGCNLFFSSLCLFAEQTPWSYVEKYKCYRRDLIDSLNPEWMAPYNLRHPRSIKIDTNSRQRWLSLGEYKDGTLIEWDYATNKIVAMYAMPVLTPIRELKKLKETHYENMICAEWDSFDDFFLNETKRLKQVVKSFGMDRIEYDKNWKKTLPRGHKDYQE